MDDFFQKYNFVPTTVNNNQFLSYRQPADYMTDYRPSSDLYAYLINNVSGDGVVTSHELRQQLQDKALKLQKEFFLTTKIQFSNLQPPGAPNDCSGGRKMPVFSGGKPLVNTNGAQQFLDGRCDELPCVMRWVNTPLVQQGPHCDPKLTQIKYNEMR